MNLLSASLYTLLMCITIGWCQLYLFTRRAPATNAAGLAIAAGLIIPHFL